MIRFLGIFVFNLNLGISVSFINLGGSAQTDSPHTVIHGSMSQTINAPALSNLGPIGLNMDLGSLMSLDQTTKTAAVKPPSINYRNVVLSVEEKLHEILKKMFYYIVNYLKETYGSFWTQIMTNLRVIDLRYLFSIMFEYLPDLFREVPIELIPSKNIIKKSNHTTKLETSVNNTQLSKLQTKNETKKETILDKIFNVSSEFSREVYSLKSFEGIEDILKLDFPTTENLLKFTNKILKITGSITKNTHYRTTQSNEKILNKTKIRKKQSVSLKGKDHTNFKKKKQNKHHKVRITKSSRKPKKSNRPAKITSEELSAENESSEKKNNSLFLNNKSKNKFSSISSDESSSKDKYDEKERKLKYLSVEIDDFNVNFSRKTTKKKLPQLQVEPVTKYLEYDFIQSISTVTRKSLPERDRNEHFPNFAVNNKNPYYNDHDMHMEHRSYNSLREDNDVPYNNNKERKHKLLPLEYYNRPYYKNNDEEEILREDQNIYSNKDRLGLKYKLVPVDDYYLPSENVHKHRYDDDYYEPYEKSRNIMLTETDTYNKHYAGWQNDNRASFHIESLKNPDRWQKSNKDIPLSETTGKNNEYFYNSNKFSPSIESNYKRYQNLRSSITDSGLLPMGNNYKNDERSHSGNTGLSPLETKYERSHNDVNILSPIENNYKNNEGLHNSNRGLSFNKNAYIKDRLNNGNKEVLAIENKDKYYETWKTQNFESYKNMNPTEGSNSYYRNTEGTKSSKGNVFQENYPAPHILPPTQHYNYANTGQLGYSSTTSVPLNPIIMRATNFTITASDIPINSATTAEGTPSFKVDPNLSTTISNTVIIQNANTHSMGKKNRIIRLKIKPVYDSELLETKQKLESESRNQQVPQVISMGPPIIMNPPPDPLYKVNDNKEFNILLPEPEISLSLLKNPSILSPEAINAKSRLISKQNLKNVGDIKKLLKLIKGRNRIKKKKKYRKDDNYDAYYYDK